MVYGIQDSGSHSSGDPPTSAYNSISWPKKHQTSNHVAQNVSLLRDIDRYQVIWQQLLARSLRNVNFISGIQPRFKDSILKKKWRTNIVVVSFTFLIKIWAR